MGVEVVGACPPHMCHTCAWTHTHAHARMLNMIISCKWPPPLGESLGIPYDVICMCVCMHVHVCMHMHMHVGGGHPLTTPHRGWTPGISQNSIALELIEIFQFRLQIWNLWRLPHPWMGVWFGGWVGGWVGWWVGSGQNTKNLKIVDWIKIIQLFKNLWFVETPPPMGGCVGGWVGQWVNGWG